ncbi:MAG: T9SS C-terminal target domain-containing protein [Gemmatimonadetes bacterium]|nr:MAG: T9SS C-terminal target domain-containing protein [Gemmatimonadota bacterium]
MLAFTASRLFSPKRLLNLLDTPGRDYLQISFKEVLIMRLVMAITLSVLIGFIGFAYADWVAIHESIPSATEIQVVQSDLGGSHLRIELSGVERGTTIRNGVTYTTLDIPHATRLAQPGAPDVPMLSTWVAVPPQARVEVRVRTGDYETLTGVDIAPYSDDPLDPTMHFVDEMLYAENHFFPAEHVITGKPQVMRDVRFVPVQILPVQVNPVTREVRLYSNMEIEIVTIGTDGVNPKTSVSPYPSRAFEQVYRSRIVNYEHLKPFLFSNLREAPEGLNLLIISPDNLAGALGPYTEWKNKKGIRTYVAPFAETGNTSTQIKAYIQELYDDPATRPEYLLFIGDANVCPAWTSTGYLSDNPYAFLEGNDEVLDAFTGRFPCEPSPLSLLTMVNRTLEYEQNPVNDGSNWNKDAVMICPQASSMETKFEHVTQELLIDIGEYDEINEYRSEGHTGEVHSNINDGRAFLNFRGYISNYGIDMNAIDPDGKYPFVTWLTCGQCRYNNNDFCVRWLRDGSSTDPEGAIGSVAGSQVTNPPEYARRRDALDLGMYKAIFEENIREMGELLLWGKEYVKEVYPLPDIYTEDTYNHFSLMGDPTCAIWTETPLSMNVDYMPVIPLGTFEFPVHVLDAEGEPVPDALISLTRVDEDIYFKAYTDENGEATLELTIDDLGLYDFIITADNNLPLITTVEAVPGMAFEGYVTDAITGAGVPADVFIEGGYHTTARVTDGFYRLYVAEAGSYQLQAQRWGYEDYISQTFTIAENETLHVDIVMNPFDTGVIEGYVYDLVDRPVENAVITAIQEVEQPPVYTDENGFYSITCPGGYTYNVRVEHETFVTQESSVTVEVDDTSTLDFHDLVLMANFETDTDDFYRGSGPYQWQRGIPGGEGAPEAYLGENVWATRLNGNYIGNVRSYLYSPVYYILDDPQNEHLSFYHWYETNDVDFHDGGRVQIRVEPSDEWETIEPIGGYPVAYVLAFNGPGFCGTIDDWEQVTFDLSMYEGQNVQFRFEFRSVVPNDETRLGWYLDNMVIYGARDYLGGDGFRVAGAIHYGGWMNPVPNAMLEMGDATTMSDTEGQYQFEGMPAGNYTLTASKTDDITGISAFDAARIAQYSAGSYDFDAYQVIAADVTGDGSVSPFDAARVAQFSAGSNHNSQTGTWAFIPEMYQYTPLNEHMLDQNFNAILMGEVTGNWAPEAQFRMKNDEFGIAATTEVRRIGNQLQLTDFTDDVLAFQFTVQANQLPPVSLPEGATDWHLLVQQQTETRWEIVAYGMTPLSTTEILHFENAASLEIVNGQINETPAKVISTPNVPQHFALHAAYPNPFNPKTTLAFDLPQVSHIRLNIYDVSGHLVRTLVNSQQDAGYHQVEWNGTDDQNQVVRSGVYVYRLETDTGFNATESMVLLK